MSTERTREALSALMDGELSDFEGRRLLRDLGETDAQAWLRWQRVRDSLQGHQAAPVPSGFSQHLNEALAQEAQGGRGLGSLAKMAVAASVAAATVIGWQYFSAGMIDDPQATLNTVASAQVQPVSPGMRPLAEAALVSQGFAPGRPAVARQSVTADPQIKTLMVRHSEFAARHGSQGMAPYARMVSLDARQGSR